MLIKCLLLHLVENLGTNVDSNYNKHYKIKKPEAPKLTYKIAGDLKCSICSEIFQFNRTHRIDHDHLTGKFRDYAHQ